MENLSEAEIIEDCKRLIVNLHMLHINPGAIAGLLDLYNNLKSIEKEHQKLNGELREELNREKEKNKILELAKIPYLKGEIMAYKENTVNKDKIKEIIYPRPDNPISYEIQTSDIYKKIEQLLEEE